MAKKNRLSVKVEFIQVGKGTGIEHVLKTFEEKPLVFTNDNNLFSLYVSDRGPVLVGCNTPIFLHNAVGDIRIVREEGQVTVKLHQQELMVSHGVELKMDRSFYMISSFFDAEKDNTLLRLEMSKGFVESMNLIDIIRLTRLDQES